MASRSFHKIGLGNARKTHLGESVAETRPRQTVDRRKELARLGRAFKRVAEGTGEVLVLEGTAGVGKTHLLRCAEEMAREADFAVMSAAGGPLSSDASFAVVLELLQPLLERYRDEAAPPELAPLLAPTRLSQLEELADQAFANFGLARLCAEASAERPLLLAVDDLQWVDSPSLAALEAIARRAKPLPILLLLGLRRGERSPEDSEAMSRLTGELLGERIEVGPLSEAGVGELLGLRGVKVEGAEAVARCAQLTGGNALLVTRVAATLSDREQNATVASLSRMAAEDAVDVAASVTSQLQRLGRAASEVAAVAAVLDDHARWRHLVAISDLDEDEVEVALDALVGSGLLEAGEPVSFTHPLVREAVYSLQAPGEIARRHRLAAHRLIEEEADPEQVASHLLLSRGEGSTVAIAQLISAARQAMRRGVPGTALNYLERALAEPAKGDDRARVSILLGRAHGQLGHSDAERCFVEARALAQSARLRAEADLGLGRALYAQGSYAEAESVLERGRLELGPGVPQEEGLAAELRATALAAARYAGTLTGADDERLSGLIDSDAPGSSRAERALLAELATELGVRGEPREQVVSLALRAWADGEMLLTADRQGIAISQVAAALVWSDAYAEADEMLSHAARYSAAIGARTGQATARYMRGWVRLYRGDLVGAISDGKAALRADGWGMYAPAAAAMLAHCSIELADLAAADEFLQLPGGDERWNSSIPYALVLEARGRMAMAHGEFGEALDHFQGCADLCLPMGEHQPFSQWRIRKALCLRELGEEEAASALIEAEIRPCRRAGAPRPLGMALTAAGVIEGGAQGEKLVREACGILSGSGAVIEHARALTELGLLMRRAGRDAEARIPLREALALADGVGAVAVMEQAAAELTAAGGRPRRRALSGPDSLTPGERRAARLAAAGHTNREIAEQLVVTPKTVQFHLSNVYRKLGVSSRDELDGAL